MIQRVAPSENPFSQSITRQNAWWIGSTLSMAVPGSAVIFTASTLEARFFCVSITPLLFPVVPEVKMMVAISSASGQTESADVLFPAFRSSPISYTFAGSSSTSS